MPPDSNLPTFIVIGAMKSGTSSLYHYLTAHPDIFMPAKKEPHYFLAEYADGVEWRKGTWQNGEEWYRRLFAEGTSYLARGEASTTYAKWPEYPGVPARIAALVPDVKLVYVVRHPIERMRSHYQHEFIRHAERRPIDEAFTEDPHYVNTSRYSTQIAQYLEAFDRNRLLVVDSDALRNDRAATLSQIFGFIGVADDIVPKNIDFEMYRTTERRVHRLAFTYLRGRRFVQYLPSSVRTAGRNALTTPPADKPFPSPEVIAWLEEELRPEMEGLRPFLGGDFNGWGLLDPHTARAS